MSGCEECGFSHEDVAPDAIADALSSFPPRFAAALESDPATVAQRPEPATWSVLEYSCHVRDVLLVQRDRVVHALVVDRPGFAPMHREERVELAAYATEDPATVAAELEMAARLLARVFRRLTDAQLARRCIYNFPEPAEVDVAWVGCHTVHECQHHLLDVTRVMRRLS